MPTIAANGNEGKWMEMKAAGCQSEIGDLHRRSIAYNAGAGWRLSWPCRGAVDLEPRNAVDAYKAAETLA
jgi:hypothetical protein